MMKRTIWMGVVSALCLGAGALQAQETDKIEHLRLQLQRMQKTFEEQQRLQRTQIETLRKQIEELKQSQTDAAAERKETADKVRPPEEPPPPAVTAEAPRLSSFRPTDPIRFRRGNAMMDLGLVGTFAAGGSTAGDVDELNPGGHDPGQRGFSVQGVEANFYGAVDPYFRGNANVNFQLDADGETRVELEEAWMETLALPWNFQLRGGQFWSEFGRHNSQHVHSWSFVDQPLAVSRLLGADGLRNPGVRASWLAPTPWYTEFFFGVQNSGGETASSFRGEGHAHGGGEEEEEEEVPFGFRHNDNDRGVRGVGDLLLTPRLAVSWDLTDTQTLLAGGSAAFGPNHSGETGETDTRIYGADLTWKWRPANHDAGFPFVSLQSEFIARKFDAGFFDWDEDGNGGDGDGNGFVDEGVLTDPGTGLPAVLAPETISDYGLYTQMRYGFRKGWVAGLRFDYLFGERGGYERRGLGLADNAGGIDPVGIDPERGQRWRLSPNLTWYPSEFSKVRLQYNLDERRLQGTDHSLWLQFEMALGAHAAHKF